MSHVWIVEMLVKGKWVPTPRIAFNRADGEQYRDGAKSWNPGIKFHLKKYVRAD